MPAITIARAQTPVPITPVTALPASRQRIHDRLGPTDYSQWICDSISSDSKDCASELLSREAISTILSDFAIRMPALLIMEAKEGDLRNKRRVSGTLLFSIERCEAKPDVFSQPVADRE